MNDRGQSTLDFLLGAVIFLLAVIVVVAAVPGMIDPFVSGGESHPIVADRAVTNLATDTLTDSPENPYVLSQDKVDTTFGMTEAGLKETLGVPSSVTMNVTLTNGAGPIREFGPAPPSSRSITAAWRVAEYQGNPANITVRVW